MKKVWQEFFFLKFVKRLFHNEGKLLYAQGALHHIPDKTCSYTSTQNFSNFHDE